MLQVITPATAATAGKIKCIVVGQATNNGIGWAKRQQHFIKCPGLERVAF
jgi:hypothetical protein